MTAVIILGDGGHSRVIQEIIAGNAAYQMKAILDDKYNAGFQQKGIIHAPIAFLPKVFSKGSKVVVAIGDNRTRKRIVQSLHLLPKHYLTVIHPSAIVSTSARIGCGTVIMPSAVINANAEIGAHCIVNTSAIVEHDNEIDDFTHLSPNTTLTGNVTTGVGVHVGAAATIIPGKHLGSWSVIGAGSTVIEHIPAYSKAVGNPTRIIEQILMN
ncbi:acetyltransferase [Lentibacillus sp. N15]|uniref:acetyltransferase n=1 Tax=Lentibacillus songyuanensis TaxID=3136161 RepID=UPI0031BA2161